MGCAQYRKHGRQLCDPTRRIEAYAKQRQITNEIKAIGGPVTVTRVVKAHAVTPHTSTVHLAMDGVFITRREVDNAGAADSAMPP